MTFDGPLLPFLAFAMIAVLAMVLRWAFGRDRTPAAHWPSADTGATNTEPNTEPGTEPGQAKKATAEPAAAEPAGSDVVAPPKEPDDFGLLAPVATVDTAEEAHRMRAVLARAGIRATGARGADGRHRVLVFDTELYRARRVCGWSA